MRMLIATAVLVSLNAAAATIDLDRPGALAALEKERPDHYRTVLQTVHATERMNCAVDLKLYQAGGGRKACVSHMIRTTYPAQVQLWIPVEKDAYTITAYLDRSQDRIVPADDHR